MTNNEMAEFKGNVIIKGKFECVTGLHIGGSKEKLEIGGVDSPVIRDPRTRFPYVPGSSIKGKLRSLLEFGLGKVPKTGEVSEDLDIVRLFGIGVDSKTITEGNPLNQVGPSRLIVRDSRADEETEKWWKTMDTDLLYTEYKSENGINRITSAANPRFIERVAAGSKFDVELVYTLYNIKGDESYLTEAKDDLDNLRMALLMLEHNFLGKSGSRGYGRIKFHFAPLVWISKDTYKSGGEVFKSLGKEVKGLVPISELNWDILSPAQ